MTDVERIRERVVEALVDLEPLFVPGMKLTFIARLPDDPEAEMVITADDPHEVLSVIERRIAAEELVEDHIVDSEELGP